MPLFLENVKGFNSKKFQPTRDIIINQLEELGYHVRMQMLNTMDYGIPQNRERLWIFAYRGKLPSTFNMVPPVVTADKRPRLSEFLEDIRVRYASKKVLVVSHSAVLRGLHYIINGIPEDGDLSKIEIPNLRVIEYEL